MTQTAVAPAPSADIEKSLLSRIEGAGIVQVVDAATFEEAAANLKAMGEAKKAWTGYWAGIKEAAHKTWKGICAKEKGPLDAIERKEQEQKAVAKVWADEEERKRREAERLAQEKAKKEADDAALAAAQALEAQGDKEGAEAVLNAPPPVAQAVVKKTVPSGHGAMIQKYYSASVTDLRALAKAALEGKVPLQAIQPNEVFLNAQARMLKDTMAWPGVQVNVR